MRYSRSKYNTYKSWFRQPNIAPFWPTTTRGFTGVRHPSFSIFSQPQNPFSKNSLSPNLLTLFSHRHYHQLQLPRKAQNPTNIPQKPHKAPLFHIFSQVFDHFEHLSHQNPFFFFVVKNSCRHICLLLTYLTPSNYIPIICVNLRNL